MTQEQLLKNLTPPAGVIDVVIDTDAYTEIDDLYAIAYLLLHREKFRVKGICAAPFDKPAKAATPKLAMEKSYDTVKDLLQRMQRSDIPVFYGSASYLPDEQIPVESPAADFMAELAMSYSAEKSLYIVAIGAISNVASAILKNPAMKENCVVVWLGGHSAHLPRGVDEYNMRQDIAGARLLFGCGIPLVHVPCKGAADRFLTTQPELERWIKGKNALCDFLYRYTLEEAEQYATGKPWSRVIWDVIPVAWLLSHEHGFLECAIRPAPVPGYDMEYHFEPNRHPICSVTYVRRDRLMTNLFETLANAK